MISATDPAEVLRLGTSSAAMVLEADHAILRLQDEETRALRDPLLLRLRRRPPPGAAVPARQARLGRRASSGARRCWCATSAEHPTLRDGPTPVRSLLAAPLRSDGARDRHARALRQGRRRPLHDRELRRRGPAALHAVRLLPRARDRERALLRAARAASGTSTRRPGCRTPPTSSQRIHEEIARAGGRDGALALAVCRIENLAEIEQAKDAGHARPRGRRARRRRCARTCATSTWSGAPATREFAVLLPEPGFSPGDRVARDRARRRRRRREGRGAEPARAASRSPSATPSTRPTAPTTQALLEPARASPASAWCERVCSARARGACLSVGLDQDVRDLGPHDARVRALALLELLAHLACRSPTTGFSSGWSLGEVDAAERLVEGGEADLAPAEIASSPAELVEDLLRVEVAPDRRAVVVGRVGVLAADDDVA